MKDYKKMWDNLYKYIQKWNDSIDIEVYEYTEIDMVRRLTRRYTLSTILDEMMDIEADAEETEQFCNTHIRCRDCMYYDPKGYCKRIYTAVAPFSYCSYAKRGEKNDL